MWSQNCPARAPRPSSSSPHISSSHQFPPPQHLSRALQKKVITAFPTLTSKVPRPSTALGGPHPPDCPLHMQMRPEAFWSPVLKGKRDILIKPPSNSPEFIFALLWEGQSPLFVWLHPASRPWHKWCRGIRSKLGRVCSSQRHRDGNPNSAFASRGLIDKKSLLKMPSTQ